MRRAYIAAPIFTEHQLTIVRKITDLCRLFGYEYFSPYESSREIWKGRAPKDCSPEERATVIRQNIDGLRWADTLVAWIGGQKPDPGKSSQAGGIDTGVVWEMGYFAALKPQNYYSRFTIAYIHNSDHVQHMNLMLAETVDAVAYGQGELARAIDCLYNGRASFAHSTFHPSRHLLHEKEPIA